MDWKIALKEYRRSRGLTQAALAERLQVDPTTISRWERGRDRPSISLEPVLRVMVAEQPCANCPYFKRVQTP